MSSEDVLWQLAFWCAVVLLFAPGSPPTTWIPRGADPAVAPRVTEGLGWLGIAALLGLVALVTIIIGFAFRQRLPAAAICLTAAAVAFGVTAIGLTRHWIELMNGLPRVQIEPGWELQPAPLVPVFAVVAVLGMGCALLLAFKRPRSAEDDL